MNKSLNEKLIDFINDIAENVFLVQFIISTIGLAMNIPHLFILLHNSMRTSSTNSIMIGIAICDLITLFQNFYDRVQGYWFYGSQSPCMNQDNYWYTYSLLIGDFLLTAFERASFWLGLFLAFTRFVIMKMMTTTLEISKPLYGYLLILGLVGLSSAHSLYYYDRYNIVQWDTWEPEETCIGYPANYSEPAFLRNFAGTDEILIGRRYQLIDGISRILVSVTYPILTILLIFEILKSSKSASKALSSRINEERHRTCRLILVMTLLYVISSAPAGFSEYVTLFMTVQPDSVLGILVGYGSIFILALFCLNASLHGIINFTMSSKYRQTVRECLGWEKPQRGSMVFVTVSKNHSHS
ncbi:unnamed protein product [Caenorhabditis nigoni]